MVERDSRPEQVVQRSRIKRVAFGFLGVAISLCMLWVLLSHLDMAAVQQSIDQADRLWLVVAGLITIVITPVRGYRYALLMPKAKVSMTTCAIGVQTFLNRIAPMRLGELSLPYLMKRFGGYQATSALIALVLVRLTELTMVTGLLVLAYLSRGRGQTDLLLLLGILFTISLTLYFFRTLLRIGIQIAHVVLGRFGTRMPAIDALFVKLHAALEGSEKLTRTRRLAIAGLTVLQLCLQMSVFAAILAAFGIELDALAIVQASCVAFAGTALPIPSVGTVGPLEASWVAGFVWVGLPLETAILTGVATQIFTLIYAAVIAVPSWLILRRC